MWEIVCDIIIIIILIIIIIIIIIIIRCFFIRVHCNMTVQVSKFHIIFFTINGFSRTSFRYKFLKNAIACST